MPLIFLITYLMSCPSAFVVCRSDCTTSLSSSGVSPLHIPFQCVSSVLFYSAWTVAKCFLLGFLSLLRWICLSCTLSLAVLGSAWFKTPEPTASLSCRCDLCLDPVMPDMESPCGVCHSPSLAVPSFVWKPGYKERRKEGEAGHGCFYPLYQASLGSSAVGLVMVAPGEHRGITLRKTV